MNTGETKMSNLLLENFINEINSKRNAAINDTFNFRMNNIKKTISNIPAFVNRWNDRIDAEIAKYGNEKHDLRCELIENGFKSEEDTRDWFEVRKQFGFKPRKLIDTINYWQVIFCKSYIKTEGFNKKVTHTIYTVDTMENIEKEILTITKLEINNVFDMYLARVVDMVAKIDYCSTVAKCDINTFDLKGYPTTKILIATENNTECEIRTSVKWNCSKYGKIFGQYPTTIHNITKNGNATQGNIFQITSDNFNAIWTEFKAHEKNTKLNRQIANLEKEISDLNSDEKRNPKYVAHQTKLKNKRIEKLQSQLVNVRQFRDVGQSLIRGVA